MKQKRGVFCESAPDGYRGYTDVNRARRFVKQGRADWVVKDRRLKFRPQSHQHASVVAAVEFKRWTEQQDGDYDGIQRLMRIHELRNLPAVGKVERAYY